MKVLVADNLSSMGVDILKQESGVDVDVNIGLTKEELIKIISSYEGLIVRSATKVTPEVIGNNGFWITEPGEYFVMGDRRENSQDSRSFGPVTENRMLGRVWLRYWPLRAWNTISTSGQTSDNNHPYTR